MSDGVPALFRFDVWSPCIDRLMTRSTPSIQDNDHCLYTWDPKSTGIACDLDWGQALDTRVMCPVRRYAKHTKYQFTVFFSAA